MTVATGFVVNDAIVVLENISRHMISPLSLSVLIALGAATVALWLTSRLQNLFQKAVAAIAMALAISGMHCTGMAAATFAAMPDGDYGTTSVGQANSRNLMARLQAIDLLRSESS